MEKGFIIVREPFKVRIMDILSLLIAIGMVIGYFFTYKNWILNDVLCVCTIVASIKVFKFTNLKIAIFAMLVGLAV
jgi:hypothetical protein